jgi:hypothetical protein
MSILGHFGLSLIVMCFRQVDRLEILRAKPKPEHLQRREPPLFVWESETPVMDLDTAIVGRDLANVPGILARRGRSPQPDVIAA